LTETKHLDLRLKSHPGKESIIASALKQTPFPLLRSSGRQYLRIDINSPVQFRVLTCKRGRLRIGRGVVEAEILNLSEGGVLLTCDRPVSCGEYILLTLNLNQLVILEGVLGKIKRVEPTEEGDCLIGVEFSRKGELEKLASPEQIRDLPMKVSSFNHKLREIITSYLRMSDLVVKKDNG
jgi:hypothetical protein